jgi:hypothetical protein
VVAGVKVTFTVQLDPGASAVAQPLISEKSPLVEISENVSVADPLFVILTPWGGLEDPSLMVPKSRLAGASFTAGATPVPESGRL